MNNKSALLVIDMQEQFTIHTLDSATSINLIDSVNEAIAIAGSMDIIFVKAHIRMLSISLKGIKTESAAYLDLDKRLNLKKSDRVYMKQKPSAFSDAELTRQLVDSGIGQIYLTGMYLGQCVSATALEGVERGFEVTIISDAVVSKDSDKTEKILSKLQKKGIHITDLDSFGKTIQEENM